ncbi:MAG TPA: hypothetical protein VFW19_00990 [Allosphingosinicella sp.]|nr:hypothetical protein [Allosphingosinicella sp.]
MKPARILLWAFAAALPVSASGAWGQDSPADRMIMLDGRCDYAGAPAPAPHELRLDCKSAVLMPGREGDVLVQFVTGNDTAYGFAGPVSGDVLTVRRIYLTGKAIPATGGHCKLFFGQEEIKGLTCVARAADATYVANFHAAATHPDGG